MSLEYIQLTRYPKIKSKNKIYLGDWCYESIYKKNKIQVCLPYGIQTNTKYKLIKKFDIIFDTILKNLSILLNKHHNKNLSIRSWKIILGPWLSTFIQIIINRHNTLLNNIMIYNPKKTICYKANLKDLITHDIKDLNAKSMGNDWNNQIYFEILKYYSQLEVSTKNKIFQKQLSKNLFNNLKIDTKNFIKNIINKYNKFNYKKDYPFIIGSGLNLKDLKKLQINNNCPSINWRNYEKKDDLFVDVNLRIKLQEIIFNEKENKNLINFIKKIIFFSLPSTYLENFQNNVEKVSNLSWPKSPKVIFTAYNYFYDEYFKFYVALNIPNSKYFIAQHGSTHGIHIYPKAIGERTADNFLAWSDLYKGKKFIYSKKKKVINNYPRSQKKYLSMIFEPRPFRSDLFDTDHFYKKNWIEFLRFINSLDKEMRQKLVVRLHKNSLFEESFDELKQLDKIKNKIFKIEFSTNDINKLIVKSNLIIICYDSTLIYKLLNTNVPFLIYIPKKINFMKKEVKKDFYKLKMENILFFSKLKLKKHINNIWSSTDEWWNQKEKIKIRKILRYKYSEPDLSRFNFKKKTFE
jgi:putative transferase (TIGR04331 family)